MTRKRGVDNPHILLNQCTHLVRAINWVHCDCRDVNYSARWTWFETAIGPIIVIKLYGRQQLTCSAQTECILRERRRWLGVLHAILSSICFDYFGTIAKEYSSCTNGSAPKYVRRGNDRFELLLAANVYNIINDKRSRETM